MPSPDTIDVLNRVLELLQRSFPQYLQYARPYIPPGRENVMETIDEIVDGQDSLAGARERNTSSIRAACPTTASFRSNSPTRTIWRSTSSSRKRSAIRSKTSPTWQQCVDELRLSPAAQSLAAEALGMAKGHLESLEELPDRPHGLDGHQRRPASPR